MAFPAKSRGAETGSSFHYPPSFSGHYRGNMLSHGLKLRRNLGFARVFGFPGRSSCKCISTGSEVLHHPVSEDEKKFVGILREAQPYIYLHRDRTFVVILSGLVIDGPFVDTIIKLYQNSRFPTH